MRTIVTLSLLALLLAVASVTATSIAQTEYYMNVGDFYDVDYETVTNLSERGIQDEDLPVVFKIAKDANVSSDEIATKRLEGDKWLNIAHEYDLSATNFYVLISGKIESKYYVPIFAKYKFTPQPQWEQLTLTDEEIRALVNLKFIYSHHDYSPYQVMAMRDFGRTFVRISRQIAVAKADMIKREMAQKNQQKQIEQN